MLTRIRTEEFFAACERAIKFWAKLQSEVMDNSMSQAEAKATYGKKIQLCRHMAELCAAVRNVETHVQVTQEDFALVQPVWNNQKHAMMIEQEVS